MSSYFMHQGVAKGDDGIRIRQPGSEPGRVPAQAIDGLPNGQEIALNQLAGTPISQEQVPAVSSAM
jgi:hypothetical protein